MTEAPAHVDPPDCPYCGRPAEGVGGHFIYPHRHDLEDLRFFRCLPCRAWCGTHRATGKPLGTLADTNARRWRQAAHRAFDPLWKRAPGQTDAAPMTRKAAYALLSDLTGIPPEACHIAMMQERECRLVLAAMAWERRSTREDRDE